MGGVIQGIAEALYEEAVYDENGTLLSGSMTNYEVPAATEVPNLTIGRSVTRSTSNEMGFKGVGETGTIASPPAVINAVIDALSHLGVTDVRRPASPENVWRTIQQAHGGGPVIPAPFEYASRGLGRRSHLLLGSNEDAKVIAGGHSLLPLMRLRFARPALLVDIDRLDDLEYVKDGGDHVEIGALTRMSEVANDPLLKASSPLMAYTAGLVGDPQVRHRGTLGGSVAHGDPASDPPTRSWRWAPPSWCAARTANGPWRRRTSSRASSRPTSVRVTCSRRSACRRPARRGGPTRSSIAARSTGPSWASRRS